MNWLVVGERGLVCSYVLFRNTHDYIRNFMCVIVLSCALPIKFRVGAIILGKSVGRNETQYPLSGVTIEDERENNSNTLHLHCTF